jgi:hypothetical protein
MKTIKLLLFAFIAFFIGSPFYSAAQVLPQDSLALVAFYNSTGGPNWNINTGWLTGPVSTWYGVTVINNRVSKIMMWSNNMVGILPNELGLLTKLHSFGISNEPGLTGIIPESIFSVDSLISISIGNCSFLKSISFRENNLTGSIPPGIGNCAELLELYLHDNRLTGSIPPEIGNCSQLIELRLNNNQLSGTIPPSLSNCNQIEILYLHDNNLTGEIPYDLSLVSSYISLSFNNNHLTGIPPWTPNWILNDLAIGGNCMTFEDLEPHFVGYMWYDYYPQDSMQTVIDTLLPYGSNFNVYSGSLGQYTTYYWFRNGVHMPGTENADTLKLINISEDDAGVYTCYAQSSICKQPNGMPMVIIRRPVTIGLTVGTDDQFAFNPLSVYPNPCAHDLKIETTAVFHDGLLHLTNMYGQVMWTIPWLNSAIMKTIHIDNMPSGVYILTLKYKQNSSSKKIFII